MVLDSIHILILTFGLVIISIMMFLILGYLITPFFVEILARGDDASYKYNENDFLRVKSPLSSQNLFPKLIIDKEQGEYSISFGSDRILNEGLVRIHFQEDWYSSIPRGKEKPLILLNIDESRATDNLGLSRVTRLIWKLNNNIKIHTVFREYDKSPFIIFELFFPKKMTEISTGKFNNPIMIFPSFLNLSPNNRVFTFRNDLFAPPTPKLSKPTSSPVMFYDDDLNSFIISPLKHFLLCLIGNKENRIECGLEGEIESIPENFSLWFICYFGKGINSSFFEWGNLLLKYYKAERKSPYADSILSHLGFWTDNGAYYYYRTEKGLSYEQTFEKIDRYAQNIDLPLRYYQLDSWWYKKAYRWMPFRIIKLFIGGNLAWEPLEENFPSGLATLSKKLRKPFIAHNRWFAKNNIHFKEFPHVVENWWGHPTSYEFWEMIMKKCQEYNIVVYEQDWLKNQFEHFRYLRTSVSTAHQWLSNMAIAAEKHNISIQYCMPTPAFFLQALEFKAVTQIRCAQDYNARFPKSFYIPNFTQTSILAYAVGLWPFFDCFMSSTKPRSRYTEHYPNLTTLVSILSAGLVGPADQIGFLNRELLMKTCRSDGVLLKPDRPATPIDLMFQCHSKYYIISTETQKGDLTWNYVVMTNLFPKRVKDHTISLKELGITRQCILYDFKNQKCQEVDQDTLISADLNKNEFFYFILMPFIEKKFAFIGDPSKFVVCSNKQFPRINYDSHSIHAEINIVKDDIITLIIYSTILPQKVIINEKLILPQTSETLSTLNSWIYDTETNILRVKIEATKESITLEVLF
ncbi:MAG: hypothetical protein ACFE95_11320 [Candidatus Hodarchaeota archaeon]